MYIKPSSVGEKPQEENYLCKFLSRLLLVACINCSCFLCRGSIRREMVMIKIKFKVKIWKSQNDQNETF